MCDKKQNVYLAGIGPGNPNLLTAEVKRCIEQADCLIGAERMLDCAAEVLCGAVGLSGKEGGIPGKTVLREYRADRIRAFIGQHPEYETVTVLLSGDTGFYSGAKKLKAELSDGEEKRNISVLPGISSIVCLAARLGISWQDAAVVSLHGTDCDFIRTIHRNRKTFLLLGGNGIGQSVYERLREFGMNQVTVHIGKRLSYPDESVVSGKFPQLSADDFDGLCAAFVENPEPSAQTGPHVRDSAFIRGKVPMTKEDVRAVSIARLELTDGAVVYDVGAGTGSVSVEAALSGTGIRVYAVEKNPEAVELLYQNRRMFFADGIRVIPGSAPDALYSLEPPTHVFIGGSSGNLKEILRLVLDKNPNVRIVINAISLETLREVMEAEEEGLLRNSDFTQLCAAKGKQLGRYHMMMGQNPVYIVSAGGPV